MAGAGAGGGEGNGLTPSRVDEARRADRLAIAELILKLRRRGIRDRRVLSAIEHVPRRLFLAAELHAGAYDDRALPIECGQTISAPSMVALMTEALDVAPGHRVLEIGTGSGYQAAVLAHLAAEVYTVERYRSLLALAEERFAALRLLNIQTHLGDGTAGWPDQAPFDRIIVTAAAAEIPEELVEQLELGGVMVLPVGPSGGAQHLVRAVRGTDRLDTKRLGDVRFVPLVAGIAHHL
jgi:protein-L-isoaspartate(D-aspartate) O-methyltransferase